MHNLWILVQIPVRNNKTSGRGCTAVLVWPQSRFQSTLGSACVPRSWSWHNSAVHWWWDRTETGPSLVPPVPKALSCPCPKAQISTVQRRQGRKEIPLCPFYRGGTAGFSGLSDLRVTSRSLARVGGFGTGTHARVGSGCWTLINTAQTKTVHGDSSGAAFDKLAHWEKLGCVSG